MPDKQAKLRWGVSYYPELLDPAEWQVDLDRMLDLGIGGVRILDFAWTAIEPREGEYHWEWLDRFLELLAQRGMWAILCTPTATPPAWLARQYPEIMIVERSGRRRPWGNRRDVDVDSPIYRHYARELAAAMGVRFGRNASVLGWQIDNELLGSELMPPECHSPASQFGFRQYLKRVHGSIATLNARWGMRFWNQEFIDWGEVETPHHERPCAGHYLDYARYFSQSQREFIVLQAEALRGVIGPGQFISHNSTAIFDRGLDHREFAEPLDVAGWDAYPGAASGGAGTYRAAFTALACDYFRSMKGGSYWIFETDSYEETTRPAHYAELAARGAAAIIHWLWRGHRAHVEQNSEAICDYGGRVRPEKEKRLRELYGREEFSRLPVGKLPWQNAAIVFDPDCVRLGQCPNPWRPETDRNYLRAVGSLYSAARRGGLGLDVVPPGGDLDGVRLLLMPSLQIVDEATAQWVLEFVRNGGVLLATAKTAHFDKWGVYHAEIGAPLADLLGFTQTWPVRSVEGLVMEWNDGRQFETMQWAERVLEVDGEVLARFSAGSLKGCVAAFRRCVGKGALYYLSAPCDEAAYELVLLAGSAAGVCVVENAEPSIGILPGLSGEGVWYFNDSDAEFSVEGAVLGAGEFALLRGKL